MQLQELVETTWGLYYDRRKKDFSPKGGIDDMFTSGEVED